jgi:hypothetical protein
VALCASFGFFETVFDSSHSQSDNNAALGRDATTLHHNGLNRDLHNHGMCSCACVRVRATSTTSEFFIKKNRVIFRVVLQDRVLSVPYS